MTMDQSTNQNKAGPRIAVVGGGVAGLAAGFRLREELRAAGVAAEIRIFEREEQCGGATRSEHEQGFTLDRGPNGWLSSEPLTARLCGELGLGDDLVPSNDEARNRFIFTRGKLYRLPDTPLRFLASGLLRPWEKLRVAGELLKPGRRDDGDETIFEFGKRRLGGGFADTLLDPMVSGIFAGDVHKLSLPATFPKMRQMELTYGGLFKAMMAKGRERKRARAAGGNGAGTGGGGPAGPSGVLTTLRGGVGRLTDTLGEQLGDIIRERCAIDSITRAGDGFELSCAGGKERFDAVVVAAPAHAAADMVRDLDADTATALGGIGFADVAVVCHAYERDRLERPLSGFGHLIPRREGIRALGCLWTSSIFPGQAAPDQVLLRTILGGAHDPEVLSLADDDISAAAREATRTVLGIDIPPAATWVFRHRLGIAQYEIGHRERVAVVDRLCEDLPNLAFVGASYRGVALNRCVRDAYNVAPRVLRHFGLQIPEIPDGADH